MSFNKFLQIILISSLVFIAFGDVHGKNAAALLKDAKKHLKRGKSSNAIPILRKIIKEFPNYQEAYLVYGRLLYNKGNLKKAANLFRKVSYDKLNSPAAFEYGMVFYDLDDCEKTINAFQLVSKKHKLYSYAMFYSGSCYYNRESYKLALKSLSNAKKLPPSLNATKRELVRKSRSRLRSKKSGKTFSQKSVVNVPKPRNFNWTPLPPEPGEINKANSDPTKQGNVTFSLTPTIKYSVNDKYQEFGEARNITSKTTNLFGGINTLLRYDAPVMNGGRPYFLVTFDAQRTGRKETSSDYKFYFSENEESFGQEFAQENTENIEDPSSAKVTVGPTVGMPLGKNIDISGTFSYAEEYPEYHMDKKYGTQKPSISLSGGFSHYSFFLEGSYADHFNSDGASALISTKFSGNGVIDLKELTIEASGSYETLEATQDLINTKYDTNEIPMTKMHGGLDISYLWDVLLVSATFDYFLNDPAINQAYVSESSLNSMKSGFSLGINYLDFELDSKIEYAMHYEYSVINFIIEENQQEASAETQPVTGTGWADGSNLDLVFSGAYKLFEWLKLETKYQYTTYDYLALGVVNSNNEDVLEEHEETFLLNIPTVRTILTYSVSVSYSF